MKRVAKFASKIYVRVSFKAATAEGFTQRTGAIGKYYELPFKALKHLLDEGIFARAAAMTDPRIMPKEETKILIEKLGEIDPRYRKGELEGEAVDAYDTSIKRLKAYTDKEFGKKLEEKLLR